jgi:hypothetical protein
MIFDRPSIEDASLARLYDYWHGKRHGRFAPSRVDIDPAQLKFILPFLYLIDVVGGPAPRFRFRLAGTGIVKEYGAEITGKFADEIDLNEHQTAFVAEYNRVVGDGKPASSRGNYTKSNGRRLTYEHLILPLSTNGQTVDKLFAAAITKVQRPEAPRPILR